MDSLVIELQKDAINPSIKTNDLLRKALLVSRKLKIKDIEEWLDSELNGYHGDLIPDYRKVRGELKVFNPYNGWNPVVLNDEEWQDLLCVRHVNLSVSQIENLIRESKDGYFLIKYPATAADVVMKMVGQQMEPALHASLHQLVRMVDTIKTKVMEFALDLEERGIMGEGMTFSREDQQAAQTITYNTINIHRMENSQIQQANDGSLQDK